MTGTLPKETKTEKIIFDYLPKTIKILAVIGVIGFTSYVIWWVGYTQYYWGEIDNSKIKENVQEAKHFFLNHDVFVDNQRVSQHCSINIYQIDSPYVSCQLPVLYPSMKNAETCETFLIMDAYYNDGEEEFTKRNWC